MSWGLTLLGTVITFYGTLHGLNLNVRMIGSEMMWKWKIICCWTLLLIIYMRDDECMRKMRMLVSHHTISLRLAISFINVLDMLKCVKPQHLCSVSYFVLHNSGRPIGLYILTGWFINQYLPVLGLSALDDNRACLVLLQMNKRGIPRCNNKVLINNTHSLNIYII